MMRCIDHPTMLKDGSGWGAMAGVSAAYLARSGFTGSPAISIEANSQAHFFADLGRRWLITEQYFKPFPVCRWAQPAIVAAMKLQALHDVAIDDIAKLSIGTFHESCRLATAAPTTTEQAQYSLPFPVAAALKARRLTVNEIDGDGLTDDAVVQLSRSIELYEVDAYNDAFPAQRISEVTISLKDGRVLESGPTEADGDPDNPLHLDEIKSKFNLFAKPVIGQERSEKIVKHVMGMAEIKQAITHFNTLIYSPGVA
jgi:2-methylcitrate dehydratase PrpD